MAVCVLALTWLLTGKLQAFDRSYVTHVWTTTEGLPSNSLTGLAFSSDGFLWVGSSRGLCRFDGVRFVTEGAAQGMSEDGIKEVSQGPGGVLNVVDQEGAGFIRVKNVFQPRHGEHGVPRLAADGSFILTTEESLLRYADGVWQEIDLPPEWPPGTHRIVEATRSQGLLAIHWLTGVWRHDGHTWSLWKEYQDPGCRWGAITEDASGAVWISTRQDKISRIANGARTDFSVDQASGLPFHQLIETTPGDMWASKLDGGLWHLKDGVFHKFPLTGDAMVTGMVAAAGILWVATDEHGLQSIQHVRVTSTELSTLADGGRVTGLAELHDGTLAVAAFVGGVWKWRNGRTFPFCDEPGFTWHAYVDALLKTRNGDIWVGASDELHQFHQGKAVQDSRLRSVISSGDLVTALCEGLDGAIWAGCGSGKIWRLTPDAMDKVVDEKNSWVNDLEPGPDGSIWAATRKDGILRIHEGRITQFGLQAGLPQMAVSDLHFDGSGTLWAGLGNSGLYGCHGERFVHVSQGSERRQENSILQMTHDDAGWLWMGGDRGITGLPLVEARACLQGKAVPMPAVHAGRSEGMTEEQCLRMEPLKAADGRLYFGTARGFASFQPADLRSLPKPPEAVIDEVTVEDKAVPLTEGTITVPPGARFEIQFTALDFSQAQSLRFRSRLVGFDPGWNEHASRRLASYARISPGRYRFEVMAGNAHAWDARTASVAVHVQPFYWQTLWFKGFIVLLVAVAAAGTTYLIDRVKARRQERLIKHEQAIHDERNRIARDLHDGLGSGLTQAGMLVEALGRESSDTDPQRLQQHLRSLAQDLETAVWAASPRHDRFSSLCSYLADFMVEYFRESSISCRITLPDELPDFTIGPQARHAIFMCAREAMNNCLKYSSGTEVHLRVIVTAGAVITIADNGNGFDIESIEKNHSHGMRNLRERMASLGGKAEIRSNARGTVVDLILPLDCAEAAD